MIKPKIGIVIPIVQKKYIKELLLIIYKTTIRKDFILCVVNDGNTKIQQYLQKTIPAKVSLINLEKNLCFAGANNAGWNFLINKYPSLKYLGTINDDAIPFKGWLDTMAQTLGKNRRLGACGPVMLSSDNKKKIRMQHSATWKLNNYQQPMLLDSENINQNQYVPVIGGFCFLARKKALEQVKYFDERFKNSCEDIDLSIKLTMNGWKLMICCNSIVYHKCGKSRYKFTAKTGIKYSRDLLLFKWGNDLSKYNLK